MAKKNVRSQAELEEAVALRDKYNRTNKKIKALEAKYGAEVQGVHWNDSDAREHEKLERRLENTFNRLFDMNFSVNILRSGRMVVHGIPKGTKAGKISPRKPDVSVITSKIDYYFDLAQRSKNAKQAAGYKLLVHKYLEKLKAVDPETYEMVMRDLMLVQGFINKENQQEQFAKSAAGKAWLSKKN